ncbi:protein transporter Sec31 [Streptomyces sp. NPDC046685]|uniref:protein transporter Sec31 n=1 Tax=Streptomyces sp. NPDC046685 TaxID=3157202 RepID=UPI00340A03BA
MRTRTETRTRQIAHTVDGETELIDEPYTVAVPLPPRDWDHIALTAVTASTAALVLASVVWSTASAGDLLARAAPVGVAYSAAIAFDLVWINCMILEWLARYDPARATLPRRAGHAALGIAMLAVGAHGRLEDSLTVGIAAAAISALAKAAWTLVLRAHSRPLDARTQAWLIQRQSRAGARLALQGQLRHLARIEARTPIRISPDESEGSPDEEPASPLTAPMTIKDAVRTAVDSGIRDPGFVLGYVRKRADANASQETVNRYLRTMVRSTG